VGWAHSVAAIIKDAADQQSLRACPGRTVAVALLCELSLDVLEQVSIKDRRMLCRTELAFEDDLVLAWIGGGLVAAVAGLWTVLVYTFPPKHEDGGSSGAQANCGGIAIGGNVSGTTITASSVTNSNCSPKQK
jgi:hypothetical protein